MKRKDSGIGRANKVTKRNERRYKLALRHIIRYEPREWTEKNKATGRKGKWRLAKPVTAKVS